jgi:NDP-4-keto-2,6-dideoxyhexose 3-C-methyltransferase
MCSHLYDIAEFLVGYVEPKHGDIVLDIGCNDGTLLKYFQWEGAKKIGIDPSSGKFADSLDSNIELINDYFSEEKVRPVIGKRNCVLITAIAMFYDLEDPIQFLRDGRSLLSDDGVLALEFSYMPLMLKNLTYDQVCHEHLTYFSLSQIEWMANKVGLKIIHASTNMINGGSMFIGLSRSDSTRQVESNRIQSILHAEKMFSGVSVFEQFQRRITAHRDELLSLLEMLKESGKKIYGYGASTKGNVVLNYCNIDSSHLCGIFDSNQEKHYRITPGSSISILPKEALPEIKPDFLLIMIWHLRTEVLRDELHYFACGGRGIITLPRTHLVSWKNYNRLLESRIEDLGYTV